MFDLDKIVLNEEEKISIKCTLIGVGIVCAGSGLEFATKAGLINYNWITGHLSDFGIAFGISAMAYGLTTEFNKYLNTVASMIPPALFSINEYHKLVNGVSIKDNADTVMYWLGWTVAIGGIKYFSSRKAKKEALKNEFKKPSSY